jgi:hypothetical protein
MGAMNPGKFAFLSSGETSPTGGMIFRKLTADLPRGFRAAILETPAGFEPNSARVAGRVAEALGLRMGELSPQIDVIPARRRGTEFGPDSAGILHPLAVADLIYMGAGSPTYAVRQLQGSLAWQQVLAGWQQGAALILASAAAVSAGCFTLPVYEIFQVGDDPVWKPGLDLFGPIGWKLAVVSHWNNAEGGEDLDTSRCFIGRERFDALVRQLPLDVTILGLDEHTAVLMDWSTGKGAVEGKGTITILRAGRERIYSAKSEFPLAEIGEYCIPSEPFGVKKAVWEEVRARRAERESEPIPPQPVKALLDERERMRQGGRFGEADRIRKEIEGLGWGVKDTPHGAALQPLRKG